MNQMIALTKDFELLEIIGRGLSSEVYKGLRIEQSTEFTQVVAIKIFKSNKFRKKFQNELKNLSKINHPNIIGVKDWGEFQGKFFLVTEYVHGQDLGAIESKVKSLSLKSRKHIVNQIFLGLNELRLKGISHADLKPSNIMISISGEIKLVDISFDDVGEIFATPEFTSPEVLSGARPSFQSDLYSLGVILLKMGLEQKKLLKLDPGNRVFEPYLGLVENEEKLNLSSLVRSLVKNTNNSDLSAETTLELGSSNIKYENSKFNFKHIFSFNPKFKFLFHHLILMCIFGFYLKPALPQVYKLKLRSLKAYEFWNQKEWISLPTDQIYFADQIYGLKKLKFRTPEGEILVSISDKTDLSKNIIIDAL